MVVSLIEQSFCVLGRTHNVVCRAKFGISRS